MQAAVILKQPHAFWHEFERILSAAILQMEAELNEDKKNYELKLLAYTIAELLPPLRSKLANPFVMWQKKLTAAQASALHHAFILGYLHTNNMQINTKLKTEIITALDKAVG